MRISMKAWLEYITKMSKISKKAADEMQRYIQLNGFADTKKLLDFAYALATKYGEAISTLSCEMYEATAAAQGAFIAAAEVAPTLEYGEVAKAINGTLKKSPKMVPGTMQRLVKQVGADTTLQNAIRDGAEFAWIPHGDTCAFCITLASRGWQHISKKSLKNGHAEHIHANCDCEYAIRFDGKSTVEGYDPDKYLEMYEKAEGNTPEEKINFMRRNLTSKREKINYGQFQTYINTKVNKNVDAIRPKNIMKDMKKSEAGKRALDFIEQNNIQVKLLYNVDNPQNLSGEYDPFDDTIIVFVDTTKTIKDTSLTVIHEATHKRLGHTLTRKEEVMCFLEEEKHKETKLTGEYVRTIIKAVNNSDIYKDLPWR